MNVIYFLQISSKTENYSFKMSKALHEAYTKPSKEFGTWTLFTHLVNFVSNPTQNCVMAAVQFYSIAFQLYDFSSAILVK